MSDQLITSIQNRRHLRERGMATVEYALGVVVVIVMIGVIIAAIQSGTLHGLIDELIKAVMNWITKSFTLPFPIKLGG